MSKNYLFKEKKMFAESEQEKIDKDKESISRASRPISKAVDDLMPMLERFAANPIKPKGPSLEEQAQTRLNTYLSLDLKTQEAIDRIRKKHMPYTNTEKAIKFPPYWEKLKKYLHKDCYEAYFSFNFPNHLNKKED
jgi:hypothetical protein